MNGYDLSRSWFNWCFDNPEKISPNHTALYFFCIEHCNRLGWKSKFGLPTTMAKEAIGIRSYNTYINTLNDLVEFGFIKMIEKSKNQYSSNIIALSKFNKAHNEALDKALIKHTTKQVQSTGQSIDSIDKQETINKETNNKDFVDLLFLQPFEDWMNYKKQKKQAYKTIDSEKAFYKKLLKLSNNDPKIAKAIVEESMANNWNGIFLLKSNPQSDQPVKKRKQFDI